MLTLNSRHKSIRMRAEAIKFVATTQNKNLVNTAIFPIVSATLKERLGERNRLFIFPKITTPLFKILGKIQKKKKTEKVGVKEMLLLHK